MSTIFPTTNSRSLPFVVFLGGFPSRCQNLSSGAIRPGGLLFTVVIKIIIFFFTVVVVRRNSHAVSLPVGSNPQVGLNVNKVL